MPDPRRADWWLQWALSFPRFPLPLGKVWREPCIYKRAFSKVTASEGGRLMIHIILTEETGLWKTVLVLTQRTSQN